MSPIVDFVDSCVRWLQTEPMVRYAVTLLALVIAGGTIAEAVVRGNKLSRREFGRWLGARMAAVVCLFLAWTWLNGSLQRGSAMLLALFHR
jgi:hypothetical protein